MEQPIEKEKLVLYVLLARRYPSATVERIEEMANGLFLLFHSYKDATIALTKTD